MDYSSKIRELNSEINRLNGVISEAASRREELVYARNRLLNKESDVSSDARWVHKPENGHDLSRGSIATEHDDARDSIDHAYAKASEQIEEMIDAIDQERNRLSREIDRTRTMVTSRRDRITTLKAKQRLHDQRGMV